MKEILWQNEKSFAGLHCDLVSEHASSPNIVHGYHSSSSIQHSLASHFNSRTLAINIFSTTNLSISRPIDQSPHRCLRYIHSPFNAHPHDFFSAHGRNAMTLSLSAPVIIRWYKTIAAQPQFPSSLLGASVIHIHHEFVGELQCRWVSLFSKILHPCA